MTLIDYSPLGQGVLSGKYIPEKPPPGIHSRTISVKYLERVQLLLNHLREIGHDHGGKTPAQVALNWVMCKGVVPIVGVKDADQARENAGTMG